MPRYYINRHAQDSGDNEVHQYGCSWLEKVIDKEYLGDFPTCRGAVQEARRRGYSTADGCAYCCPNCNKGY